MYDTISSKGKSVHSVQQCALFSNQSVLFSAKLYFIFLCMATEHTLCDHNTTHQTLV